MVFFVLSGGLHHPMEVYTLISWYQVDIDHKAFIKDTVCGQSIRRFAELCLVQNWLNIDTPKLELARGVHMNPQLSTIKKLNL